MRIKLILWVIVIGLAVGTARVAGTAAQERLQRFLSDSFHRKVTIGSAHWTFFGIVLNRIRVPAVSSQEGTPSLSVDQAILRFSLLSLLKGHPAVVGVRIRNGELTWVDRG